MSAATALAPRPEPPAATAKPRRRETTSTWRLTDRLGLAFAWLLGLVFCAIAASIVIYLLIEGIRYVRPSLLVTHPTVGYTENQTGGFLDPMIGTLLVAIIAMAIASSTTTSARLRPPSLMTSPRRKRAPSSTMPSFSQNS